MKNSFIYKKVLGQKLKKEFQMKKNVKWGLAIIILAILFPVTFSGCSDSDSHSDSDPTYTVWTDKITYSDFTYGFETTLDDGYYAYTDLTDYEWAQIAPALTDEGKNYWNESQIRNWFIGNGFGNPQANQATAWLMTVKHGFLASRTGSYVYLILK